jgi:hypothetical protein
MLKKLSQILNEFTLLLDVSRSEVAVASVSFCLSFLYPNFRGMKRMSNQTNYLKLTTVPTFYFLQSTNRACTHVGEQW